MALLTLTTDYGYKDYDVAALKGQLLQRNKDIRLIDISHGIDTNDLIGAAYTSRQGSANFPSPSYHLTVVKQHEGKNRLLAMDYEGKVYMFPDNGTISLMFPETDLAIYEVGRFEEHSLFDLVNKVIVEQEAGRKLEDWCKQSHGFKQSIFAQPAIQDNIMRAMVFFVDSKNNAVLNIHRDKFEEFIGDNAFEITFLRYNATRIHERYDGEGAQGRHVCRFNDAGYLEIAIYGGNAAGLLGLQYGTTVVIERKNS